MTFKPGDTGRTRDGRRYEVVDVDRHLVWPIRAKVNGEEYRLRPNGSNYLGREDGLDLLPPSETDNG